MFLVLLKREILSYLITFRFTGTVIACLLLVAITTLDLTPLLKNAIILMIDCNGARFRRFSVPPAMLKFKLW